MGWTDTAKRKAYLKEWYLKNKDTKVKAYQEANREKRKAYKREYFQKNKEVETRKANARAKKARQKLKTTNPELYAKQVEAARIRKKAWRDKNRLHHRATARAYYAKNPEQAKKKADRYLAALRRATPKWLPKEDMIKMYDMYNRAKDLTLLTGVRYVVDHICPLRGNNSSGLHVPWNLRIITETENLYKGNSDAA